MSPVSSATGMNSDGGTWRPSGRVQRASASRPVISRRRQADDRLVEHRELFALDRLAQLGLERQPASRRWRASSGRTAGSRRGRPPWRDTSRCRRRAARRPRCGTAAPPSTMPMLADAYSSRSLERDRLDQRVAAAARRPGRPRRGSRSPRSAPRTRRRRAAPARRRAAGAPRSRVRDGDQELVADQVAQAVVDQLEAVEVDEEHRVARCRRRGRSARSPAAAARRTAGGWAARSGDRGAPRCASVSCTRRHSVTSVCEPAMRIGSAALVADRDAAAQHPADLAVGMVRAVLVLEVRACRRRRCASSAASQPGAIVSRGRAPATGRCVATAVCGDRPSISFQRSEQ